jgi:hypothetical protein
MVEQPRTTSAPPTVSDPPPQPRQETGFYSAYAEFAKNLRLWFLAYGIGATAIFVTNESAGRRLLSSGVAELVIYLFLGGVALQVFLALLYKTAMWHLYMGEFEAEFKAKWWYKRSEHISDSYSIELACDLATIGCFGAATYLLVKVFIP